MANSGNTGIKRLIMACVYSWQGFKACFRKEEAFRQEVYLAVVLIPVAIWLDVTTIERILMIGSIFLVMMVEILNSAIEALVDRVGLERHKLSGRAKDMGSAAVMLSLINLAMVWLLILLG